MCTERHCKPDISCRHQSVTVMPVWWVCSVRSMRMLIFTKRRPRKLLPYNRNIEIKEKVRQPYHLLYQTIVIFWLAMIPYTLVIFLSNRTNDVRRLKSVILVTGFSCCSEFCLRFHSQSPCSPKPRTSAMSELHYIEAMQGKIAQVFSSLKCVLESVEHQLQEPCFLTIFLNASALKGYMTHLFLASSLMNKILFSTILKLIWFICLHIFIFETWVCPANMS